MGPQLQWTSTFCYILSSTKCKVNHNLFQNVWFYMRAQKFGHFSRRSRRGWAAFQYKQKFFSNCTPLSSPSRSAFPDWVEILVVLQQKLCLAHQVVNNRIIALFHGPVDRLYKRSANKEGFLTMRSAPLLRFFPLKDFWQMRKLWSRYALNTFTNKRLQCMAF